MLIAFDPQGKSLRHYAQNVSIAPEDSPKADITFPIALNDHTGIWKIIARDVATGTTATVAVQVR